jgi:hypothetical protein
VTFEGGDVPKLLIQNYGLFWTRSKVFWGKQHSQGHLKGIRVGNRRGLPFDFREQQGVYVLYDDSFRSVYVGQAGSNKNQRLFNRLKQHCKDKLADRWTRFSWFGIRQTLKGNKLSRPVSRFSVEPNIILDQIEAILISSTEPPLNLQGDRFGKDVKRYLQYKGGAELRPEAEDMIHEIWKKFAKPKKGSYGRARE